MKNYTNNELKEFIKQMKNGIKFCAIPKIIGEKTGLRMNYGGQTGQGLIWYEKGYDGKGHIFWRHYGESANSVTIRDLCWILNTILGADYVLITPAKWNDFFCGYIPISPMYAARDYNSNHIYTVDGEFYI